MAYDLFAAPVPVPEMERATMIGLRFECEAEALNKAYALRRSGWCVYRISGPGGYEMGEGPIEKYCYERANGDKSDGASAGTL